MLVFEGMLNLFETCTLQLGRDAKVVAILPVAVGSSRW
jgi:hypothetical protein